MVVLAVDPGKRKCGLAVVSSEKGVLDRQIVPREELGARVRQLLERHSPQRLLVGGSTGSREVQQDLRREVPLELEVVDERHTTEKARLRYFQEHPPRGLWRLIPLGLQVPPRPYDDYAAVVIAEDFLSRLG
jgi:RNase H-fold protein (predicted Holliday junction resolvase)